MKTKVNTRGGGLFTALVTRFGPLIQSRAAVAINEAGKNKNGGLARSRRQRAGERRALEKLRKRLKPRR